METKLDRAYQLELLQILARDYPKVCNIHGHLKDATPEAIDKYVANMIYLEQHQLIDSGIARVLGPDPVIGYPCINCRGMDLLANDGGLSAILGVVTVRLEADTLKAILEAKINESHADPTLKQAMIRKIRELPLDAIKTLSSELLKKGLDQLPNAVQSIQTLLF